VDETIGKYYRLFVSDEVKRTSPLLSSMTPSMKPSVIKNGAIGKIRLTVKVEGKSPLDIVICFRAFFTNDLDDLTAEECVTNHVLRRMAVNIGGDPGALSRSKTPMGILLAKPSQREIDIVLFKIDIVLFRRFMMDELQCLTWRDIHSSDLPYRSKAFVEALYMACDSFQAKVKLAGREEYINYVHEYQAIITHYESCINRRIELMM